MSNFKCPECKEIHTAEEWDCQTSFNYDDREDLVKMSYKDDGYFYCPSCKEEVDGEYIEEVK